MLAINFDGAVEIGKPQNMTDEECSGLPVFRAYATKPEATPEYAMSGQFVQGPPYPFTLTAWKPSKEDIEAILRGEPIWVRILSHLVHPMSLFTLDEAGQINQ